MLATGNIVVVTSFAGGVGWGFVRLGNGAVGCGCACRREYTFVLAAMLRA